MTSLDGHSRSGAKLTTLPKPRLTEHGPAHAPSAVSHPYRIGLAANNVRSAGCIADLESQVRPDWWQRIFDGLYLETDGDVLENAANTRSEVDTLVAAAQLKPGERVLDLCCGQGRHTIELARRGFHRVAGVDFSPYLIELARQRAQAAKIEVNFLEGDARHCGLAAGSFDCVAVLGNSFGYFESSKDDAALLSNAKRLLQPGGRLALDLVDGDWLRQNFESQSWEWLDTRLFVCRQRSLSRDGERLVTRELIVNVDHGAVSDRFFAERLYSKPRISALLKRLGFEAIRFHDAPQAQSNRGADLGMMARRSLVTAQAGPGRVWPRSSSSAKDVAVVLGDPRLHDAVKPGGQFGAEDRVAMEKLQAALATLPGYRFRYLNDHAALVAQLQNAPPVFALNLCDEGYRNDPALEGHVPALLDIFGIPYTGAGPGCLVTCYDKSVVRGIAQSLGVPVPVEVVVGSDDAPTAKSMPLPALVKPCFGDNSVGIDHRSVARTPAQIVQTLQRLREMLPDCPLLVQEYLSGSEYSVGAIGNPGQSLQLLPILHVDYSGLDPALPPILAYASKWEPNSPYARQIKYVRATLPEAIDRRLVHYVTRLFRRLGCRDYARFDFRVGEDGEIKLLEVNPNPGWCWDGKLNKMAGLAGLSYPELLGLILKAAERRIFSLRGAALP